MLIKGASLLQNGRLLKGQDIQIVENRIAQIGPGLKAARDDYILEARGKLAIPGMVNGHTHLAMTLFRGYADDMDLIPWLQEKIWPLEAKLEPEDVYWGAKLGCLELIRFGTTCFCDMYILMEETARAAKEMGLRACLSGGFFDSRPDLIDAVEPFIERWKGDPLIMPSVGPHAVYSCSEETLLRAAEMARRNDVNLHIHLSETGKEVEDSLKERGMTPVEYLDSLGFLGPLVVAAHCIWISRRDAEILAHRGVNVVHTPISNMKLAAGTAPVDCMVNQGVNILLGTDGPASNNNLNLFEEMKTTAVVQKNATKNPTALRAGQVWQMATENAYRAFRLDLGLWAGALADLVLLDLKRPWFVPETDYVSHLVYSAPGLADTTIVDGKVLMERGEISGEEEILAEAGERFEDMVSR